SSTEDHEPGSLEYYRVRNRHPKYEAIETPFGTTYTAFRPGGEGETYHRVGHFLMPFCTMTPSEPMGHNRVKLWVPIDDHHTMLIGITAPRYQPFGTDKNGKKFPGMTLDYNFLPNTSDWLGRWRIQENPR